MLCIVCRIVFYISRPRTVHFPYARPMAQEAETNVSHMRNMEKISTGLFYGGEVFILSFWPDRMVCVSAHTMNLVNICLAYSAFV